MGALDAGVARARGLAARLVPRERLHELLHLPGSGALAHELSGLGYPVDTAPEAPESLEAAIDRAISRGAARRLQVLSRWLGSRPEFSAVLFLEEERRALRALLRGTAWDSAREARRAHAVPTPLLPERRLDALAACPGPAEQIATLARWGHPCAAALAAAHRRHGVDPFALDVAASRALVERARSASRGADAQMRAWIGEEIDLENAWTLLLLGGSSDPAPAHEAFLPGGAQLGRARFERLAGERDDGERRAGLAKVFLAGALGRVFDDPAVPGSALETRALRARLAALRRAARLAPLGWAPILAFATALRAEVADLRRIHWGIVQAVSPDAIGRELVGMS
jgi:vacuolar-type H+-ATPase subunit C/Vma6